MKLKIAIIFFFLPLWAFAQDKEMDWGASLNVELEKDLSRFFTLSMSEEVRLVTNNVGFDRSVTSLGIDYSLFDKKMKVGAYYAFMYLYNNDYLYEPRHRYYLNVSYKHPIEQFTLSWRGRVQGTYRDENHGRYKINPKYIMKNKFEAEYTIWGSPWKPFLSFELSNELNDPMGNDLDRIRFQGGTSWRHDRTTYFDFFIRFDNYMRGEDNNVLSVGIAYKKKI